MLLARMQSRPWRGFCQGGIGRKDEAVVVSEGGGPARWTATRASRRVLPIADCGHGCGRELWLLTSQTSSAIVGLPYW